MLVTNSRVSCYAQCPRKHYLQYVQRIRPVLKPYPLRFGTLVHLGLEAIWLGKPYWDVLLAAVQSSDDYDQWDLIKAEELLRGYAARWSTDEWETIHVEHEFRLPLFGQHQLGGKLDALARRRSTGEVYVIEHKTSSENITLGSEYWSRLTLDSQVSTYVRAAKELGHDVAGVLYDVIGCIALRPYKVGKSRKTEESPEEYRLRCRQDIADHVDDYYVRGIVVRTEREEAEAAADLLEWSKAIVAGSSQRNTKACKTLMGSCPYIGICTGVDSIDDRTKYYVAEEEHEELSA